MLSTRTSNKFYINLSQSAWSTYFLKASKRTNMLHKQRAMIL